MSELKLFEIKFYDPKSGNLRTAIVKGVNEVDARQNLIVSNFDNISSVIELTFNKFNVCFL